MNRTFENTIIEVTEDDISHGTACVCGACPIARAVRRETGANDVDVTQRRIRIGKERFVVPKRAKRFILNFDNEWSVKPFSFRLELK